VAGCFTNCYCTLSSYWQSFLTSSHGGLQPGFYLAVMANTNWNYLKYIEFKAKYEKLPAADRVALKPYLQRLQQAWLESRLAAGGGDTIRMVR